MLAHMRVQSIRKGADGETVESLEGRLHLEGSVKATKWKLTWLPDTPELVPLTLVDFGYLISKKKIEEDDVFEDFVGHQSVGVHVAFSAAVWELCASPVCWDLREKS